MAIAELNHDVLKTALAGLLSDPAVFSQSKRHDRLRHILVGVPPGGPTNNDYGNYAYITNSSPIETIRRRGTTDSNHHSLEHTIRYDIIFFVDAKDSQTAEKRLDDVQENIMKLIEAEPHLGTGTAYVDMMSPERVDAFNRDRNEGTEKQGRRITVALIKTTGVT